MKTVFIPRTERDTYFMPAGKVCPTAGETAAFLLERHPLYGPECRVDRMRCTIAGKDFLLLTVIDGPASRFRAGRHGARLVSVPAILAASPLAGKPCTIRCGEELVVLGRHPEVLPAPPADAGGAIADTFFASETELATYAAKEKIRLSLYPSRRPVAALLTVLVCIVLTAFMAAPGPAAVPVRTTPPDGMSTVPAGTSVRGLFAAVVASAAENGAVIEEFRYSPEEQTAVTVVLKNGNPETLRTALGRIPYSGDIGIRELRYAEGFWRYEAVFAAAAAVPAIPVAPDRMYELSADLEGLCRAHRWHLAAAVQEGRPLFTVTVSEVTFHLFPEAFFGHCTEKKLAVSSLRTVRNEGEGTFTVALAFADGDTKGDAALPSRDTVSAAFGLAAKPRATTARTTEAKQAATVGKIEDSSAGVFVFSKNASGKITVYKETEQ